MVTDFAAVNIVTGWCLFSDRVVRFRGTLFSGLTPSSAAIDESVRRIESA